MQRAFSKYFRVMAAVLLPYVLIVLLGCGKNLFRESVSTNLRLLSPKVKALGSVKQVEELPLQDDLEDFKESLHYEVKHGAVFLTWQYFNLGDYNQDGIVDIADYAPIAEHYGHEQNGAVGHAMAVACM